MEKYSVLMSIYIKEKPDYLRKAVDSMLNQTVCPSDFVIVCDGPVTEELDFLLDEYVKNYPGLFQIIRMPQNLGVGHAVNVGLPYCKYELIAKMDADDISIPARCEMQLKCFEKKPDLTVLGGYILEFSSDIDAPCSRRVVPCSNADIRKYARRRQPFNNMTVMYRKSAILNVGGFRSYTRGEDYDLYVRILNAGYYCENLATDLVYARIGMGTHDRRVSLESYKGFIKTRWNAYKIKYSSLWDFSVACGVQTIVFLCPAGIQKLIYERLLHKRPGKLKSNVTEGNL